MTPEKKKTVTYAMHPEIKDLTDEQRELYTQIRDLYRSHCLEQATKRYQIGELVWLARNDKNKYGEELILKISNALGISWQTLYRWSNVTVCFGPDAFQELMQKRTRHGNRLSWTHLEILTHAGSVAAVNRLVDAVMEQDLSTDALEELLQESLPEPPSKPSGPRVPRSPLGGLRALSRQAADVKELCEVFDKSVTKTLRTTEPKKIQPGVLEELKTCEAELESMIEAAIEQLDSVRGCIQALESGLIEQAEAKEALKKAKAAHGRERLQKATAA